MTRRAEALAWRVLGAIVLGAAVGPAAAVLPLIEQGSNSDNDPCADPKAPAAAGAPSSRH